MAYHLFRVHHWKPEDFFNMGPGQRRVVHGFFMQEIEDWNDLRSKA